MNGAAFVRGRFTSSWKTGAITAPCAGMVSPRSRKPNSIATRGFVRTTSNLEKKRLNERESTASSFREAILNDGGNSSRAKCSFRPMFRLCHITESTCLIGPPNLFPASAIGTLKTRLFGEAESGLPHVELK